MTTCFFFFLCRWNHDEGAGGSDDERSLRPGAGSVEGGRTEHYFEKHSAGVEENREADKSHHTWKLWSNPKLLTLLDKFSASNLNSPPKKISDEINISSHFLRLFRVYRQSLNADKSKMSSMNESLKVISVANLVFLLTGVNCYIRKKLFCGDLYLNDWKTLKV